MDDASLEIWSKEVVQLRPGSRRVRYLVDVAREPCEECSSGTRTLSVWVTVGGRGEVVAWCSHCFNAICFAAPLNPEQRARYQSILEAVAQGHAPREWEAVRPAVEDLERRGLI